MIEPALERVIADLTAAHPEELEAARTEFHARTGAFEVGDACYEERIRAFFDWFLCAHRLADGDAPAARWARRHPDSPQAAAALALLASERGLFEVDARGLTDRLGGGRYRVRDDRVREGDRFDGRLVVLDEALLLAPGIVFHPPETHEPMDELLAALGAPAELDRGRVLDGLLRMRMRLERFTSIRPRHIYRVEALGDRDILSAGWARKQT